MKVTTMLLAVLAALLAPISVSAQGSPFTQGRPGDARIPLTVVMVDGNTPPSVMRRVSEPRNVLVVDARTVNEQNLSDAITAFLFQETRDPSGAQRSDRAMSQSTIGGSAPPYRWASEAVRRLKAAERRRSPAYRQEGRILQLWVLPLGMRERNGGRN